MRKHLELNQGCMAKAGKQEMTFVLLSRDSCSPATIRFWVRERIKAGKNTCDDPQILEALECARVMAREKKKYPKCDEEQVIARIPGAQLYGGSHGKVWIANGQGYMLSDVCYLGTSTKRRADAWASALKRLEEGTL